MNKKINGLAIIPVFGSVIVLFWLYIKAIKKEINRKKFIVYFFSCGLMGGLSMLSIGLLLRFMRNVMDITVLIEKYGLVIVYILGGYLVNIYTFLLIKSHWGDLYNKTWHKCE